MLFVKEFNVNKDSGLQKPRLLTGNTSAKPEKETGKSILARLGKWDEKPLTKPTKHLPTILTFKNKTNSFPCGAHQLWQVSVSLSS